MKKVQVQGTLVPVRRWLPVLLCVIVLAACQKSQPIYNVAKPVPQYFRPPLNEAQVLTAITRAMEQRNWRQVSANPGLVRATLTWSNYSATIDIAYSTENYTIRYDDSEHLRARGEKIHMAYNRYVKDLENAIDRQFVAVAAEHR